MKQWYEELFENYAQSYDAEEFTKGTNGECDFIEKEIRFDKTVKVLDIGCGIGALAYSIAQKTGASVVGIDTNASNIIEAPTGDIKPREAK